MADDCYALGHRFNLVLSLLSSLEWCLSLKKTVGKVLKRMFASTAYYSRPIFSLCYVVLCSLCI